MTLLSILPERVFLSSFHPSLPFPFFLSVYFLKELIFIRLFMYSFWLHRVFAAGRAFLWPRWAGPLSSRGASASDRRGFSRRKEPALGAQALVTAARRLRCPVPCGIEPLFPVLAVGFLTTGPPGKSRLFLNLSKLSSWNNFPGSFLCIPWNEDSLGQERRFGAAMSQRRGRGGEGAAFPGVTQAAGS